METRKCDECGNEFSSDALVEYNGKKVCQVCLYKLKHSNNNEPINKEVTQESPSKNNKIIVNKNSEVFYFLFIVSIIAGAALLIAAFSGLINDSYFYSLRVGVIYLILSVVMFITAAVFYAIRNLVITYNKKYNLTVSILDELKKLNGKDNQ